jgi:hypothetical protein
VAIPSSLIPQVNLRASGLSDAPDCFRRWAAGLESLQPAHEYFGFDLNEERDNIGAVIGTACHAGPEALWKAKIDGRPEPDAIEISLAKFREKFNKSVMTDAETRDQKTAESQIRRMVYEFLPFARSLKPLLVEFAMRCHLGGIYYATGHLDVYDGDLIDEKFGKQAVGYQAQGGMYSMQLRTLGRPVRKIIIAHTPRHSLTTPQKKTRFIEYPLHIAEEAARQTADTLVGMTEKYLETGDPWSFPANNHSDLCAKKWCRAHGTKFCTIGRINQYEN